MNHRPLALSTALALALAASGASAMGLGQLQVKSGLNQPLVAEIPIISATAAELQQLDVRLASPDAFARVGLEPPGEITANLQFSVGKNARGQPVIRVTTPERFTEPLLNFLIEADWGKGVVTREYAALVDPPYIAPAIVRPMQAPAIAAAPAPAVGPPVAPVVEAPLPPAVEPPPPVAVAPPPPALPEPEPEPSFPSTAQTLPASEPEPAPVAVEPLPPPPPPAPVPEAPTPRPSPPPQPVADVPPAPAPEPAPVPEAPPVPKPARDATLGPVAPGQTLSGIANEARPPGVSVDQMMIALLRANPEAFDQDNVNRLRRGAVLRVPGQDDVTQLSAAEAAVLVRQQANAWRTPRAPVPQPVEAPAPQPPEPATPTPPAPREENIAAQAPTPAAPHRAPARGARLEIVPPAGNARAAQSGAAAGAGGTELRAELVQAREELAAKSSQVEDLQSRLGDLEKQQADRQRLIDLQNSQMKELQDRLHQLEAQSATPAAPAAAPAAAAAAATPAGAPAPPVAAAPAVAPWYLNPFLLGGGVLVALGAIVFGLLRSKSRHRADDGPRLSDDDALRASIARTRQAGEKIARNPENVVPVAVASAPDTELDALKEAVARRPQDLEAHLSLLRLYHARGDALDYEQAAQAMRGQVPTTMDPRWREAVIMGASLMPGNPLFGQAGWNAPRFDPPTEARNAPLPAGSAVSPAPAAEPAAASPDIASGMRVFDEPASDYDSALHQERPLIRDEHDASELNLDDPATVFGDVFGRPPSDIHRSEAEVMAEDQGSATRIELAKAYLDIGDVDGARSMLEEVLIEGGPSAKAEAGRILGGLP